VNVERIRRYAQTEWYELLKLTAREPPGLAALLLFAVRDAGPRVRVLADVGANGLVKTMLCLDSSEPLNERLVIALDEAQLWLGVQDVAAIGTGGLGPESLRAAVQEHTEQCLKLSQRMVRPWKSGPPSFETLERLAAENREEAHRLAKLAQLQSGTRFVVELGGKSHLVGGDDDVPAAFVSSATSTFDGCRVCATGDDGTVYLQSDSADWPAPRGGRLPAEAVGRLVAPRLAWAQLLKLSFSCKARLCRRTATGKVSLTIEAVEFPERISSDMIQAALQAAQIELFN
jgi:hypothetical protein